MSDPRRRAGTLVLALLVVLLAAGADEADLETNRRLLERRKADPEHYARLRRDLAEFYAMPDEARDRVRKFDHELHEYEVGAQLRLWKVLERYARWAEALPDEPRRRIAEASTVAEKVAVIRDLRTRDLLEQLPAAQREAVKKLPPERQPAEVARLRAEERKQRDVWMKRSRAEADAAQPKRLADFSPEVQAFFANHLKGRLTAGEDARLKAAEGKWPDYARTLKQIADSPVHQVLPPLLSGEVTALKHLPKALVERFKAPGDKLIPALRKVRDRWPDFAVEVARVAEAEKLPCPPLGASRPSEFPPETREFLEKTLPTLVSADALKELKADEGKWPAYPRHLHRLARGRFVIPGMTMPDPHVFAAARTGAAPRLVADTLLANFAAFDLSPEDRAALELSPDDPDGNRGKLEKAYIRQKKAEQQKKAPAKKPKPRE